MPRLYLVVVVALFSVAACGGDDGAGGPDARGPDARGGDALVPDADPSPPTVFGGERPATLTVPTTYDATTPTPLVVALHGYYTNPDYVMAYLRLDTFAEDHGALLIAPDGTMDPDDNYFWNASDACCDLFDAGPDDVGYLATMVGEIRAAYNVDPARIFVIGHSNGGFMALRLACEHPEIFAAAISHAGAAPSTCTPATPVSVLQVHGDTDSTIQYTGGTLTQNNGSTVTYPSATETVAALAAADGCAATTESLAPIDLINMAGDETLVTRHTGCPSGIDSELWTAPDGGHVLLFASTVPERWWTWLSAHPKPGT